MATLTKALLVLHSSPAFSSVSARRQSEMRIRPNSMARSGIRSTSARLRRGGRVVRTPPLKSLVLDSGLPVLDEFWAPWCGPCRMIHPVVDELAKQYTGKLKCYKVNTGESPSVATQYGIRSIPTVIVFKDGEKKDAVIGAVPKSTLTTSIEKFM